MKVISVQYGKVIWPDEKWIWMKKKKKSKWFQNSFLHSHPKVIRRGPFFASGICNFSPILIRLIQIKYQKWPINDSKCFKSLLKSFLSSVNFQFSDRWEKSITKMLLDDYQIDLRLVSFLLFYDPIFYLIKSDFRIRKKYV